MKTLSTTLTETDLASLEHDSWIDPATAEGWGLSRVTSTEGSEIVGRTDREDYSGVVFPVYVPGESAPKEYFLRRDHPPMERHNGTLKPARKYLAPPGRDNRLIYGPAESLVSLSDSTIPIMLVEGLKKTMAAYRLSRWECDAPRFLAMGLSGVYRFRGTIGKTTDASGARVSIKGIIPDIDRVTCTHRHISIVYDSDALTNPSVSSAREALAEELRERGARVITMFLPALDGLSKTGFDDLCARWGPLAVLDWLAAAETETATVAYDPQPISLDTLDVPPFPTNLIPTPWLRDMIEATGAATETPVELPLMLSLGVVATCVQRTYAVEPEPGYTEPTNIWIIVALESGSRKSAVVRHTTAPLLDFERDHARVNARAFIEAGAARRLAEDRVKHLRQKAAWAEGADLAALRHELFEEESAVQAVLIPLRLWAQDITPEKLGQLMANHGEKMAILSDEGGIFDILGGRYNNGVPNFDLFLQAHSATAYRVDRGSRPSVFLERPALTLVLSPQPSVLRGMAAIPGSRGRGLLARPLYALPHSTLGARTLSPCPIPDTVRATYHRQVQALLSLPPRADGHPHLIRLTDSAYQEWKGFQRHVEDELRDGGTFEHIRDWAGKLPGSVARLAGLLHCAEHTATGPEHAPIGLTTMEAALELGATLERHPLAVFGLMAVDSSLEAARKIWAWIARQRQVTVSKRDCFKGMQSNALPDVASLEPTLALLIERGYLLPLTHARRSGRPSPSYRVNQHLTKEWE